MERVLMFLPSVLIIAGIVGITHLYLKWIIRRFGDDLKSVEWHRRNKQRVAWLLDTPILFVYAPTIEELICRAPLIIAFSTLSSFAWYGVLTSSVLFSLLHWFGKKISISDVLSARERGETETDCVDLEIERLHQKGGREIMAGRVLQVVFALPGGILLGYCGIKCQSIWVSVGIHSAWNLVMPVAGLLLALLGTLGYFVVLSLWHKMRRRR